MKFVPKTGLLPATIAKIRAEYAEGIPIDVIAREHCVSKQTVNKHCQDIEKPPPQRRLTDKERAEIMARWLR